MLVVLTADHGVAPLPELSVDRRMGGGGDAQLCGREHSERERCA